MSATIFQCEGLCKAYPHVQALQNISLTLERGKIYGLIGNNGAGKTTLLRLIMGLSLPTAGTMSLFGQRGRREMAKCRKHVGALIEEPIFYDHMTGAKNLEVLRILKGIPDRGAVDEALGLLRLADKKRVRVRHYSYGMKQRLGLAAAMLGRPELLVLDEPINGLDPSGIREIREMLLAVSRERETTVLISSHYLEQLYQLATDYIIIHKGRILQQIGRKELEERCSRYVSVVTDDPPAAMAALESALDHIELKVFPEQEIRVYHFHQEARVLADVLSRKRIGIRQITSVGVSLEEYFAGLVGGEGDV